MPNVIRLVLWLWCRCFTPAIPSVSRSYLHGVITEQRVDPLNAIESCYYQSQSFANVHAIALTNSTCLSLPAYFGRRTFSFFIVFELEVFYRLTRDLCLWSTPTASPGAKASTASPSAAPSTTRLALALLSGARLCPSPLAHPSLLSVTARTALPATLLSARPTASSPLSSPRYFLLLLFELCRYSRFRMGCATRVCFGRLRLLLSSKSSESDLCLLPEDAPLA